MTKELAIRILRGDVLGANEQTHEAVFMAIRALKDEPKHGRWIEVSDGLGYIGEPCESCSVCGMQTDYPSNYCPHCGAKMDESTMGQVKPTGVVNEGVSND